MRTASRTIMVFGLGIGLVVALFLVSTTANAQSSAFTGGFFSPSFSHYPFYYPYLSHVYYRYPYYYGHVYYRYPSYGYHGFGYGYYGYQYYGYLFQPRYYTWPKYDHDNPYYYPGNYYSYYGQFAQPRINYQAGPRVSIRVHIVPRVRHDGHGGEMRVSVKYNTTGQE